MSNPSATVPPMPVVLLALSEKSDGTFSRSTGLAAPDVTVPAGLGRRPGNPVTPDQPWESVKARSLSDPCSRDFGP